MNLRESLQEGLRTQRDESGFLYHDYFKSDKKKCPECDGDDCQCDPADAEETTLGFHVGTAPQPALGKPIRPRKPKKRKDEGWWKVDPSGSGGIDPNSQGLANQIPGQDTRENYVWGDEPADVLYAAFADIIALFESEWGRKPYLEELEAGINFVMGPYRAGDEDILT